MMLVLRAQTFISACCLSCSARCCFVERVELRLLLGCEGRCAGLRLSVEVLLLPVDVLHLLLVALCGLTDRTC